MMLYLWARKNPNTVVNFFDVFHFRSCFLPYFMLSLIVLGGYDPTMDILGSLVGHLYFYLEDIVPYIPETRDYRLLKAPLSLKNFCERIGIHNFQANQGNQRGF